MPMAMQNSSAEARKSTTPQTATSTTSIIRVRVTPEMASRILAASLNRLMISPVFRVSKKRMGRSATWS